MRATTIGGGDLASSRSLRFSSRCRSSSSRRFCTRCVVSARVRSLCCFCTRAPVVLFLRLVFRGLASQMASL